MKLQVFLHRCSAESLPAMAAQPVMGELRGLKFEFRRRRSKQLRTRILRCLASLGWSGEVRLSPDAAITVTSMQQQVALCLQTGNMSRFYADMLKLQYLYTTGKACGAIYIIPTKLSAREMGDNLAHFDRFVKELTLFANIITVPVVVIGLE